MMSDVCNKASIRITSGYRYLFRCFCLQILYTACTVHVTAAAHGHGGGAEWH